jgi:ferredoxin
LAWARTVPRSAGIPVALVSISGGGEVTPNLACRVALGRELRKRGYDVAFERSLVMPSNWMVAPQPLMVNKLLEVLPRKVTATCDAFLAGQRRRSHPGLGNRLLARLGRLERFGAREFGKRIRVGPDCNGCGSCARLCPVGNIVMADGKPRFGDRCSLCLACLYGCPTRALEPAVAKFVLLPDGYDMAKMARDHVPVGDFDVRAATKGFAWLGLRRYLLEAD